MARAIMLLQGHPEIALTGVSALYATPPWGIAEQPEFLNACIEIETNLAPQELLGACLSVEKKMKRVRDVRWGPRTIDLDILAMEGVEHDQDGLTIPHSRLTERAFALAPLCDLVPELLIGDKTAAEWLSTADEGGITKIGEAGVWYAGARK